MSYKNRWKKRKQVEKYKKGGSRSARQAKRNPKRKNTDEHIITINPTWIQPYVSKKLPNHRIKKSVTIALDNPVTEAEFASIKLFMRTGDRKCPDYTEAERLGRIFCISQYWPWWDGEIFLTTKSFLMTKFLHNKIPQSRTEKAFDVFNRLPILEFILKYKNGIENVRYYRALTEADIRRDFAGILPVRDDVPLGNRFEKL